MNRLTLGHFDGHRSTAPPRTNLSWHALKNEHGADLHADHALADYAATGTKAL